MDLFILIKNMKQSQNYYRRDIYLWYTHMMDYLYSNKIKLQPYVSTWMIQQNKVKEEDM